MSQDFENKLIMAASLSGIVCFMVWFFREPLARFMDVAVMGLLLAVGLALLFGVAFGLVGLWGYIGHVWHGWRMAHIEAVNTATFSQVVGPSLFTNRHDLREYAAQWREIRPKSALVDTHEGLRYLPPVASKEAIPMLSAPPEAPMPDLIPTMVELPRILLIGGTGAGKTNTLKHFIAALAERGERLTIIDPHSPSRLLGQDVIGAGLNFEAIGHTFIDLMLEISRAYADGTIAQDGNRGEANRYLIIEEFRDIVDNVGHDLAAQFLKVLLVRGRKAGFKFCLVSQNDSVAALGLKGDTGLLQGCERIELKVDRRHGNRKAMLGWRKAEQYECQVPTLFHDYPTVPSRQLVINSPSHYSNTEAKLARAVISLNGTASQTTKAEIYRLAGVTKGGKNNRFLDQLQQC